MNLQMGEKAADGFIKKDFRMIGMEDEDQFFDQIDIEELPIN